MYEKKMEQGVLLHLEVTEMRTICRKSEATLIQKMKKNPHI